MSKKIDETVVLLIPAEDYSKHRLSKYICPYLGAGYPFNLYYYEPLKKLFSKVIVYDYVKQMTTMGVKDVNDELINLVRKEQPKYVIWITLLYEFLESTSDAIRKEGFKVVGVFFDDEWRFEEYSKWWVPHLDYCVTNDIEALPKYRELAARVIHTIPCNVAPINCDWSNKEEKYDVSFVGHRKHDREKYVNKIKKRNILIHLFGPGWEDMGGRYVSFEEMMDIFGASKINLNFSMTKYNKLGWKGRIFQVCGAGGFLLTEYTPGIENYFNIDKEIVCFHNAEEMIDKIKYYLAHETERRAIAQAGWKRVISEYTPVHMMHRIFSEIEKDIVAKDKEGNLYPPQLEMPMKMRKRFSNYYLDWAVALSLGNYKDLWKDALELSISYNPSNIWARFYCIIVFFPSFIRYAFFRLYKGLFALSSLAMEHFMVIKNLVKRYI